MLLELKAVQQPAFAHEIHLINYLTATGIDVGLLINLGQQRLAVKRKHRLYRPSHRTVTVTASLSTELPAASKARTKNVCSPGPLIGQRVEYGAALAVAN